MQNNAYVSVVLAKFHNFCMTPIRSNAEVVSASTAASAAAANTPWIEPRQIV